MNVSRDIALIDQLRSEPAEATWLEFKSNNTDPEMIGVRCSALANAARLEGRDFAYMVWGIEDASHDVLGTSFYPDNYKKGNQTLLLWLANSLQPSIAFHLRRMRMCEEQGSGLDKVVQACEVFQLPAPWFRTEGSATQAVLYGPRGFAEMTQDERVRACYFHAVLRFLSGEKMKNATLCSRLGIEKQNAAQATAVINRTREAGLIRVADPERPRAGYVPHWA